MNKILSTIYRFRPIYLSFAALSLIASIIMFLLSINPIIVSATAIAGSVLGFLVAFVSFMYG